MKERPMLFSGPMVRALLDGSKTQTRRVVKMPDPYAWRFEKLCTPIEGFSKHHIGRFGSLFKAPEHRWIAPDHPFHGFAPCPYGQSGDRLWVRESHWWFKDEPDHSCGYYPPKLTAEDVVYRADGDDGRKVWRPSIHMPRWASRTTLEVTGVRVERLQDISPADCEAEGVQRLPLQEGELNPWYTADVGAGQALHSRSTIGAYHKLWEQINGPESWDANPFVWVVEFRRITP